MRNRQQVLMSLLGIAAFQKMHTAGGKASRTQSGKSTPSSPVGSFVPVSNIKTPRVTVFRWPPNTTLRQRKKVLAKRNEIARMRRTRAGRLALGEAK